VSSLTIQTDDLVESLARLEHEQWMHWSQAVAGDVPEATRAKWSNSWRDYAELNEVMKEADRVWARKVIALLQHHNLIQ